MHATQRRQFTGILLAAGKGERFDPSGKQDKLLQILASGDTVVAAAAKNMLAALPELIVVVRDADGAVAKILAELGCRIVVCNDSEHGMSASLRCGLGASPDATGWIIGLGDMPYIAPTTVIKLTDALSAGAEIAAPIYNGRRGNPVGFGRRHLPALLNLSGDHGAREILLHENIVPVYVEDGGILHDVDVRGDICKRATSETQS